ncbi:hypothetical protein PUNSTDRAFT_95208 [Punctularia strigosozonata HHB-11173 SS5]|uniref:uncharacterized protein n=1 Tax=Punctularia strigosozonata (strain HHB-11173) TaxID=741275 RepID=UPI00044173FA|nr:uncharacterized protein PUNSTDRAFT_95208 [Punctularia strigosozonata HHB-11173 SS5]EIN13844.1 hypothetical protein PUNSTDRAFT_95208 [Punctularia strigosozonata HHB-11173 SS5]
MTSAGSTFFISGGVTAPTSFTSVEGSQFTSSNDPFPTTSALSGSQTTTSAPGDSTGAPITSDPTSFHSSTSHVGATSSLPPATPTVVQNAAKGDPVCIGDGLDAQAGGLVATLILPTVIGILLWLLFAFLRPRFRQLYALREWFVESGLRPRPLGDKLWAFLFPPVPLVPEIEPDVSDAGRSVARDAALFPSDEQLTQRSLWVAFLIVLGWSILALAGALPLYLVNTNCLAHTAPRKAGTGVYSTLQDLSLVRLLQLYAEEHNDNHSGLLRRASSSSGLSNARIRIIVLTVLVIVLGVLPALWKILREYTKLVAYRNAWLETRCGGQDMAWLSAQQAPGFLGWGEKRLKDFITKAGLSSGMEGSRDSSRDGRRTVDGSRNGPRRPTEEEPLTGPEGHEAPDDNGPEIDIQSLFTISETARLATLIEQRDEILENLEIAETRYIQSFRVSTPDPSIADYLSTVGEGDEGGEGRPYISRPKPLGVSTSAARRRPPGARARARNPAYGSSSLTPTSYLLPSQYYKLRRVEGVSGGTFTGSDRHLEPSLSDSWNQRVVGSRFQEISRASSIFGRLQLGQRLGLDKEGTLSPTVPLSEFSIPDPSRYGPNHPVESSGPSEAPNDREKTLADIPEGSQSAQRTTRTDDEEWVDLMTEYPQNAMPDPNASQGEEPQGEVDEMGAVRRRPLIWDYPPSERRDTFPMRANVDSTTGDPRIPPPHLRLQAQGPFVRPLTGLDHEDLGHVYADISLWRSKLKAINADIQVAQSDGYADIAEGARIKGWLIVGRGLHFIPGIQMIEGRAKEDVRWDKLQYETGMIEKVVMWSANAMMAILLAAALMCVAGLALGTAPNVGDVLPFLNGLTTRNDWIAGLATGLAPAVAGSLFIAVALLMVNTCGHLGGDVSISGLELTLFKTTFYILAVVCAIWLMAIGAVLFAFDALRSGSGSTATMGLANGSIYMSALALDLVVSVAIISPALLLLQPWRLYKLLQAERASITPRQRFRAIYPRSYNPSFATACCVLAIIFASTFALLFPLIGPAVVLLLILTLIAHRYLIGYVYARTHSQTGGLLQIWLLRRFGTLVAFQPLLLGFILLTRRLWEEGGVLIGTGLLVVIAVEAYTTSKSRRRGVNSLSPVTRNSLDTFVKSARPTKRRNVDDESTDLVSSLEPGPRMRGSMASVLEMMSVTLAVMPSTARRQGPVPLPTETLDDLTATERAARTHPEAPPHLPPLPFADHAQEMSGILYAPELVAPTPIIWLPNDSGGVAHSEAYDLQRYHGLQVTLAVISERDARRDISRSASRASRR